VQIDKDVVCRVIATHDCQIHPGAWAPSWLTFIARAKDSLWSVDLFRCESILRVAMGSWRSSMRFTTFAACSIKPLPYAPMSHPFVERPIGTISCRKFPIIESEPGSICLETPVAA